ncbi:PiggyBac transposable element-derived protein 4 [Cucumispora dikerogammari]|nr:PiggyBac transposable element-derived protein 4 [Cucumispora dikerogammari]
MIWCDKRPVALIINCFDTREMVSKNNKQISKCTDEYNTYMGCVDKFDQMIKYYPLKRKTNRWPNRFTFHIIQILLHSAYILYKQYFQRQKIEHFEFHCKFIEYLLKDLLVDVTGLSGNTPYQHFPIKNDKRSDCVYCREKNRKRNTAFNKCKQCNVFLCVYECFSEYHNWNKEVSSDDKLDSATY